MEFSSALAGQAGGGTAVDGGCGAAVCVSRVDVAGLSDAGLRRRLGVLGEAESQLEALAELILHPEKGKATGIALVLVADYDATHEELVNARISDGAPLPGKELVRLACEADIFPAVFNARTQDLWLGRRRRCASDAQRIALMVRDKACVGCGADANRHHQVKHDRRTGKHSVVPPPDAFPDSGTAAWQPKQLDPVLRN